MQTYLLKLPNIIPPSYNKHLNIIYYKHQVKLSQEAKEFQFRVKSLMSPWKREPDEKPLTECYFKVNIVVCQDWFFKNNNLKKQDVQNLDKILCDTIFQKLGVDDSRVIYLQIEKLQSKIEVYTSIIIESMEEWS